jgi:F-type H+-transporting ATPase subunit epsilon
MPENDPGRSGANSSKPFSLEIMTPAKKVVSASVISLIVPASYGYLGVWANHAPLIAALQPGKVTYWDESGRATVLNSAGSGLIEVYDNKATVLADKID